MSSITVSPASDVPGAAFTVKGTGFDPKVRVAMLVDGAGSSTNRFRPAKDGTFSVGILTGTATSLGKHTVRITKDGSTSALCPDASFNVAKAAEPPPVDVPPVISSVVITPTNDGARVNWHVSEVAQGVVEYGPTTAYGKTTPFESSFTYQDHVQSIVGEAPEAVIHCRIKAIDKGGNVVYSADQTFTVLKAPIVLPFPGFAQAENAVSAGGTVTVPAGTYKLPSMFYAQKPGVHWLLDPNAIVDLSGLSVPIQQGGVTLKGVETLWQGGVIQKSTGSGIVVDGDRTTLKDARLIHNVQEGYVWHGADGLMQGGENGWNNETGQMWDGSEQGCGKAHAERLVIDGVWVHHIGLQDKAKMATLGDNDPILAAGQGLWFDQWYPDGTPITSRALNAGAVIRNCLIEYVFYAGIMYEVSRGGAFTGNVVHHSGFTKSGSGFWGSGILVSSSQDADVSGNLLAYNQSGVRVIGQSRPDRPGVTRNVKVFDNDFIGNTKVQLAFVTLVDADKAEFFNGSNRQSDNRFYGAAPALEWNGRTYTDLAQVNALPGSTGGSRMLSAAEAQARLTGTVAGRSFSIAA